MTKNIGTALANCFKLLKPGGKLVLGEFTHSSSRIHFVLGGLPSWWHFEDHRVSGPLLDEAEWNRRLVASNFSGSDLVLRDDPQEPYRCSSVIVTTKPVKAKLSLSKVTIIQPQSMSADVKRFSAYIEDELKYLGLDVNTMSLEEGTVGDDLESMPISDRHVVSLLEAETPFVAHLSENEYDMLKKVLLGSRGGLWVTRSGRQLEPAGDPAFSCITGLLRSQRTEKLDIRINELALSSQKSLSDPDTAKLIPKALKSIYESKSVDAEAETEFVELNGRLYIPRLYEDREQNKKLDLLGKSPPPELQPFSQEGHPLKLEIGTPGMLDTLRFVYDTRAVEPLGNRDVEIEVRANGMNFV